MDMDSDLWSGLPSELVERALSFLPVLDLCRLRSVCKRWNALISSSGFHDLCDQNRSENAYLFVTQHDYNDVDPSSKRTMSLLDLSSRRWYSQELHRWYSEELHRRNSYLPAMDDSHLPAMDDGLTCDMIVNDDASVVIIMSDPLARTRRELPELPVYVEPENKRPIVVTSVDDSSRNYRVFVITDNDEEPDRRIFVYESARDEWRALKSPPVHLGLREAVSAASFNGMLYVIFRLFPARRFLLLSYDLRENVWKLYTLKIPKKKSRSPQLVVSCGRLFTMMWVGEKRAPSEPKSEPKSYDLLFEVREVLVGEFSSRMVVQLTTMELHRMFGEITVYQFDVLYCAPLCNSSGVCKSLVLMMSSSGKLIEYHLASGEAVALPPHPVVLPLVWNEFVEGFDIAPVFYQGEYTKLSLRNLSSPLLG